MGVSLQSGGRPGGGRRGRARRHTVMHEINVTPFVDVMLVLLIVFMVAAPLMTVGVPIDLPQTQAQQLNTQQKPVTVSVTNDGSVFIGDQPVQLADLTARVAEQLGEGADQRIYVRGDMAANYGAVMQVMGALSAAGYGKIGLITEQAQDR